MRLVIVDGLDGVGKDTHAEMIKRRYESLGERVVLRSHPESDNVYGRKSKKALLGAGKGAKVKATVFYALDVLRSLRLFYKKKDVDTLIMVRYLMGTAYLPKSLYRLGYRFCSKLVPSSEYMLFLDAPPKELLSRISRRGEVEIFETEEALIRVRKKAMDLVQWGGWSVIDTNQPIKKTHAQIESVLNKLDKEFSGPAT